MVACKDDHVNPKIPSLNLTKDEKMKISQNSLRKAILKEQEQIKNYLKRQNLLCIELPSGVHYLVLDSTRHHQKPTAGQVLRVSYDLKLMDGTVIETNKSELLSIDFQDKESGLFEAIKKMNEGESAIIIIPSYRAHGLAGDDNKIPPMSTLIYHIKIEAFL